MFDFFVSTFSSTVTEKLEYDKVGLYRVLKKNVDVWNSVSELTKKYEQSVRYLTTVKSCYCASISAIIFDNFAVLTF